MANKIGLPLLPRVGPGSPHKHECKKATSDRKLAGGAPSSTRLVNQSMQLCMCAINYSASGEHIPLFILRMLLAGSLACVKGAM